MPLCGFRTKVLSPDGPGVLNIAHPGMTPPNASLAVIDGTLCQLSPTGAHTGGLTPLATAIVEFLNGPLCCYVLEHPYGLLPGLPNLYCLDGDFRLQWMAEWPDPNDPCAAILSQDRGILIARSTGGTLVRLDALTGHLLGVETDAAAAV